MRYYVIADDGAQYGPADMGLLQSWASEGRVQPHHMLQPEYGGGPVNAMSVPGLQFPGVQAPYGQPTPYGQQTPYGPFGAQQQPYPNYYSPSPSPYGSFSAPGSTELRFAWACAIIGFPLELLCHLGAPLGLAGIVFSYFAGRKGQRASMPMLLSFVLLGLVLAIYLFIRGAME